MMKQTRKQTDRRSKRCLRCAVVVTVIGSMLLAASASGETPTIAIQVRVPTPAPPVPTPTVDQQIELLRRNWNEVLAISHLAQRSDPRVLGVLREAFEGADQKAAKQAAASWLLRLGSRDKRYFDYIANFAKAAVESDVPYPGAFDSEGRESKRQYSQAFLDWCAKHNVDPGTMAYRWSYAGDLLPDVMWLARAKDRRSLPILMQGLHSKNYLVVLQAAEGLALLRDKAAVKAIIAAGERSPRDVRPAIGRALASIDDSQAQSAAERLIGNKALMDEYRRLFKEKGPEALF